MISTKMTARTEIFLTCTGNVHAGPDHLHSEAAELKSSWHVPGAGAWYSILVCI